MNRELKQILLPLLTAFIWGSAFVAQKGGSGYLGALTFSWTRYLMAAAALSLVLAIRNAAAGRKNAGAARTEDRRTLLRSGLVVGTMLALGSSLQQLGVGKTTAGKAGFITALYIVVVPLLGRFLGKRVRALVWMGVAVAVGGLYFLSFDADGGLIFNSGDVLVLLCALAFSVHILCIDHFTKVVDPLWLSCLQFAVASAELMVLGLIFEGFSVKNFLLCMPFLLYTGILSGALGYTLQIIAQKDGDPTVVSLLLSLESLFAVISGAVVLHERLSPREYLGCALMLCAVILVQLPEKKQTVSREETG